MPPGTRIRRAAAGAAVCIVPLGGCTADPARPPVRPSTVASSASPIQRVIRLGGREALGLAVHDDAVWAISYQASSLSKVDPETGAVTGTMSFGTPVATLMSAGGALWAASYGGRPADSKIYRIDPGTATVVATIESGEVCCDLTYGAGAVWAVDPGGAVLRVDPVTNRVAGRIAVPVDRTVHTNVVFAGDSLWVASDSTPLFRIRAGGTAIERLDAGGGVPFLARGGRVWGANPTLIWAVDEVTGQVVERIPVPDSMEVLSLGIGDDAIWAGIRHRGYVGAVLRIDRVSKAVLGELRDVDIPARIELGFGSVWITDSGSDLLYRVSAAP